MDNLNKLTTIYLVRHAETEWNAKKIIQGHSDSPLTPKGLGQAEELAQKLKEIKFDYIYSSDLGRNMKTAEIINARHNLAIQATKLLRERTYGDLEGKDNVNFKEWDDIIKTLTDEEHYVFKYKEDMESDEEIFTRFMTFVREMAIIDPGKTILAVTSGGFMRALLVKLGYGNYSQLRHGAVTNGGLVKLQTDGADMFLKEVEGVNLHA